VVGPSRFDKCLELIGRPDLAADPTWNIFNLELYDQAKQVFDECFARKSKHEWAEMFQNEGIICTPVNRPRDVCNDPHWKARNFFVSQEHPQAGSIRFPRGAVRTDPEWWQLKMPAPALGQHTAEILKSLEYTSQDIAKLYSQEVI